MPGWQSFRKRAVAALSVLPVPLAGAGCGQAIMAQADRSVGSQGNPVGAAADAVSEVCLVGRPTGEGVECQAFRAGDGRLYTLIGDLGGLSGDDDVCVCGQPVEMSTCMQGTTITVTRIAPPDACP